MIGNQRAEISTNSEILNINGKWYTILRQTAHQTDYCDAKENTSIVTYNKTSEIEMCYY